MFALLPAHLLKAFVYRVFVQKATFESCMQQKAWCNFLVGDMEKP
jgi:hypothetical protein